MKLKIKQLSPDAKMPTYGTPGSACFDLYSIESGWVNPDSPGIFDTGLAVEIPEGHVMLVYSRSGHGFKNDIRLGNGTGIIDCVTADTEIKTVSGWKTINDIMKDNTVHIYSYNVDTEMEEIDTIKEVWSVGEKDTIHITFDNGEELVCTPTQLVLTTSGWKHAKDLLTDDGVVDIEKSEKQEVFDMTVNNNRNFITRGAILHNCDYRGPLKVKLTQDSNQNFEGDQSYRVEKGERIAQAMVIPIEQCEFEWVDELSDTERGAGGMQSTGKM